jgi:hypothetical protein
LFGLFRLYGQEETHMDIPTELKVAIELAQRTAAGGGRVAIFGREMFRLLKKAEERLTDGELPTSFGPIEGKVVYIVDRKDQMLAEHRTSGKSKPFRCPKALYEAVTKVLASAERPLAVEEIASEVGNMTGEAPAEYQVRVPLRLFMSVDPALVSRNRARYRAITSDNFATKTKELWAQLRVK